MKRKIWTEKEIIELSKVYKNTSTKELAKLFECSISQVYNVAFRLGLKKDENYLKKYVYTIEPNVKNQFKKGNKPWNKGIKGLQIGGQETQFKKGNKPHNYRPLGSKRIDKDGFTLIKVTENKPNNFVLYHRYLWEQHNGKIPKGYVVAFKDGNKSNICIDNLELITYEDNMKRNSVHNLPEELKEIINLKKTITKLITENGKRQNSRS